MGASDFLRTLLRHLRSHVVLLWDRGTIHQMACAGPLAAEPVGTRLCSDLTEVCKSTQRCRRAEKLNG